MIINADNKQTAAVNAMLTFLEKGACQKVTVHWRNNIYTMKKETRC